MIKLKPAGRTLGMFPLNIQKEAQMFRGKRSRRWYVFIKSMPRKWHAFIKSGRHLREVETKAAVIDCTGWRGNPADFHTHAFCAELWNGA